MAAEPDYRGNRAAMRSQGPYHADDRRPRADLRQAAWTPGNAVPGILRAQSRPRAGREHRTARDRKGASPAPGAGGYPIIVSGGAGAIQSLCLAGSNPGAQDDAPRPGFNQGT